MSSDTLAGRGQELKTIRMETLHFTPEETASAHADVAQKPTSSRIDCRLRGGAVPEARPKPGLAGRRKSVRYPGRVDPRKTPVLTNPANCCDRAQRPHQFGSEIAANCRVPCYET